MHSVKLPHAHNLTASLGRVVDVQNTVRNNPVSCSTSIQTGEYATPDYCCC